MWWIILRFTGDLPEPKRQVQARDPSMADRNLPQDMVSRKNRRFSHMVGLDQVGILKTLGFVMNSCYTAKMCLPPLVVEAVSYVQR